jgi:transposase
MRKATKSPGEKIVKDIKRATRKRYSSEEKIRIVLGGLRSEDSIAELCRRDGISQDIYYKWSTDLMEAGKRRQTVKPQWLDDIFRILNLATRAIHATRSAL